MKPEVLRHIIKYDFVRPMYYFDTARLITLRPKFQVIRKGSEALLLLNAKTYRSALIVHL